MIGKKMKGVHDGIALPTGVAATAAVGPAQARGNEKKPPVVDITQYSNLSMSLDHWNSVSANITASLQQVSLREKAAQNLLDLPDVPPHEKRAAEAELLKLPGIAHRTGEAARHRRAAAQANKGKS